MEDYKNSEEDLTNFQVASLLHAVDSISDVMIDIDDLAGFDLGGLLKKANNELMSYNLDWSDAAKLLGVTASTVKRWQTSKYLNDNAKQKIAALCSLLAFAKNKEYANTVAADLVSLAISKLQKNENFDQDLCNHGVTEHSLNSVFGVSGLMATAWYLAINPTSTDSDTDTEE